MVESLCYWVEGSVQPSRACVGVWVEGWVDRGESVCSETKSLGGFFLLELT